MEDNLALRVDPLMERIHNFRDFGGCPVSGGQALKKGLLYRSGSLADASEQDLQRLTSLGIRAVCDLRTPQERSREPSLLGKDSPLKIYSIPIQVKSHREPGFFGKLRFLLSGKARQMDFDATMRTAYREYVIDFAPQFARVLRIAADPGSLPLLIHCTAGKDRTGYACSLILLALGAPLEVVMAEYLRSNEYLDAFKVEMLEKMNASKLFGLSGDIFLPLLEVRRGYLEGAFEQIRRECGGFDAYLRERLGLTEPDLLRLHSSLLERPDEN